MSEEIEVTINVTGEEAIKILNAKEQEITYLKNEIARLLQQTQHSEPQLTIPKDIADELDSIFAGIDATDIGYVLDQTGPYGSRAFNDYYFKNKNIIALYLAGKSLGVDLVKVVEG